MMMNVLRRVLLRCPQRQQGRSIVVKSPKIMPELDSTLLDMPLPKFILQHFQDPKHRNEVAMVDGSTGFSLTYGQIHENVYRVANSLRRLLREANVDPTKACIAIMSPNHMHYFTAFQAIALIGAKSTTLNPLCTEDDACHQLTITGCQAVFAHPMCLPKVQAVMKRLDGKMAVVITLEDKSNLVPSTTASTSNGACQYVEINELINHEPMQHIDCDSFLPSGQPFDPSSILTIPFSSGTTGKPKGVMLSHRNIVANVLQCLPFEGDYLRATTTQPRGTLLVPLPFFHIFGLTSGMLVPLYGGGRLVFMPSFDLQQYLEIIQKYKVTRGFVVPPIVLALAKHPMVNDYDLSSLQCLMSGAAPLGSAVQIAASTRLSCVVKQGWGMTETSPGGAICPDYPSVEYGLTDVHDIAGRAGPLVPGTQGLIVHPVTGEELPFGEEGELLLKGPQVMLGYYKDVDATAAAFRSDGWLRTGDIARFDSQGWLCITDRCKELIKYKGFQVPPAELEAVIASMSGVKDVVVIPVEDDEAGEIPRAYVVRQETDQGLLLTEKDVVDYVYAKVAPHKRLRGGCVFTESVPKSPSGKLLRRVQIEIDRAARSNDKG